MVKVVYLRPLGGDRCSRCLVQGILLWRIHDTVNLGPVGLDVAQPILLDGVPVGEVGMHLGYGEVLFGLR